MGRRFFYLRRSFVEFRIVMVDSGIHYSYFSSALPTSAYYVRVTFRQSRLIVVERGFEIFL
jgi:hypothetical protein